MSLDVKFTPRSGTMYVEVTGTFSLEEAQQNFVKLLGAVKEHGTEKILADGRGVLGEPATIERFYYGEFVASAVKELVDGGWEHRPPQFAYVLREPVLDPLRLGETVAVNRGMNIKVFEHYYEALEWLSIGEVTQAAPSEAA